jgi:hypothetical protein
LPIELLGSIYLPRKDFFFIYLPDNGSITGPLGELKIL